jgi:hypothetical protein
MVLRFSYKRSDAPSAQVWLNKLQDVPLDKIKVSVFSWSFDVQFTHLWLPENGDSKLL